MNLDKQNSLVVVVILNYNQNEYTIRCVESILESNYPDFKIVLLDNGSEKENFIELQDDLPKDEKLLVERLETNIGYAQGTNHALAVGNRLKPDFFLIMNNDTILDKNAIMKLVEVCDEFDRKALVTGKVFHYDRPDILQFVGYELKNEKFLTYRHMGLDEKDVGQYDRIEERDMIDDIFVLQPAQIFNEIGGYTEYLWINGVNIDMGLRCQKLGYKLIFTPDARLWHKGSLSIGGRNLNPKLVYWNIESALILRWLYLSRKNFRLFYLKVLESSLRTKLKALLLSLKGNNELNQYSEAKFKAIKAFRTWRRSPSVHNGFNPY
jgi:GT2 family glycosyltransferase